jgi:hypothetical protein
MALLARWKLAVARTKSVAVSQLLSTLVRVHEQLIGFKTGNNREVTVKVCLSCSFESANKESGTASNLYWHFNWVVVRWMDSKQATIEE